MILDTLIQRRNGNRSLRVGALILFIAASFFAGTAVSAQDADMWYLGKPIADFSFIGLRNVNIADIKPIVKDYIGKNFSMDLFYEIQDKLYALERFETIASEATEGDAEKKSVIIKFTVTEKPIVMSIQTEGNQFLSKTDILDKVLIKKGAFVNEAQIKIDEEAIRALYIEKGFNEITVSSRTEKTEDDNVTVFFTVNEGFKTTIKEIKFSGNSFASESTLRGEVVSKQQDFFNPGIYLESKVVEDRNALEKYYKKYGFIKAKVEKVEKNIEKEEDKGRTYLTLVFYINEGDQYTFGGVTVDGNVIFAKEKLIAMFRQQAGKFFNKVEWETDFQSLQSLYYDAGYISNRFIPEEKIDEVNKQVSYHIKIIELERAHIENIIISGNEKTIPSVILRELPFEPGDIFSTDKIRQGIYNLYNLQYFSNITPQPIQGSAEGLMDLIISVEEQHFADFKLGIAFSGTEFPISGQVGWSDKNFLGTGITLGFDLEASIYKQGFAFNFQDNYLFGKNFGGGISLSYYHTYYQNAQQDNLAPIFTDENVPDPFTSREQYEDAIKDGTAASLYNFMPYDSHDIELGGNLSYFMPTPIGKLGASPSVGIKASYITYEADRFRHYNDAVRDNLDQWNFVITEGVTFYLDSRDIYYNPEKGYLLSQYIGFTGLLPFEDRHYIKLKSRAEYFLTLFKIPVFEGFDFQTVLALHAGLSFVLPQFGYDEIVATETEKLYIDGMNTGRGWNAQWDGEAQLDLALELRHPLVKNMIWWSWFFDAVAMLNDYSTFDQLSMDDFLMSFGAGLRLTIPGLPIRMYFAQPFKIVDGEFKRETGGIPFFDMSLKFVVAITMPGGF